MSGERRIGLEVCAETLADLRVAAKHGADRVELCSALSEGGVTPGPGLLAEAATLAGAEGIEKVVLVRPRGGDFRYDADEFLTMLRDVEAVREAGLDGVVVGLLTRAGAFDRERLSRLVEQASPLQVAVHRAFDLVADRTAALEMLVELGITRILTTGGGESARGGAVGLRNLVEQAAGRLEIMAGGGVRSDHVRELVEQTGVSAVHSSARTAATDPGDFSRPFVGADGAEIGRLREQLDRVG